MIQSRLRPIERRRSTRRSIPGGRRVVVRRVGRRNEKCGVLLDVSTTGALVELSNWLPLGALVQLRLEEGDQPILMTVVRTALADDFTRRYGLCCLHDDFPVDGLAGAEGAAEAENFGLNWPSTRSEIRRAYRTLARTHHPDVGGSDAEFRRLHQEYLTALANAVR